MHNYCKAYRLQELHQFAGWSEQRTLQETELTDDTIIFLCDDWTVVESPIISQESLFDQVSPAWIDFCTQTLQFAIPEDLQYVYTPQPVNQMPQTTEAASVQ